MLCDMKFVIKQWLPLAFLTTVVCGLVYGAVQQNFRQSANDPQIQMAEDAAVALNTGTPLTSLAPVRTVDIAASLSPYLVFYNDTGAPIGGDGFLHGNLPALPPD